MTRIAQQFGEIFKFTKKKVIAETLFPGLTLKTVLNRDFYWNKYTLYIKIPTLLKHYYSYMYSTLFVEITQRI
jgi:hypothetical protein